MNSVLEPILKDALTRYTKFNRPELRDAVRILGPALEAVCLDAKAPATRATEWLQAQSPEALTEESVRSFIRTVTEVPAEVLAAARMRQEQIEKEIASERPLTAREKVLMERMKPLSERTRDSILAELFEARTGYIRGESDGNYAQMGEQLPGAVFDRLAERESMLQAELDARDCRANGVEYRSPTKRDHSLDMIPAMRG